jgi:hypothetical protein
MKVIAKAADIRRRSRNDIQLTRCVKLGESHAPLRKPTRSTDVIAS